MRIGSAGAHARRTPQQRHAVRDGSWERRASSRPAGACAVRSAAPSPRGAAPPCPSGADSCDEQQLPAIRSSTSTHRRREIILRGSSRALHDLMTRGQLPAAAPILRPKADSTTRSRDGEKQRLGRSAAHRRGLSPPLGVERPPPSPDHPQSMRVDRGGSTRLVCRRQRASRGRGVDRRQRQHRGPSKASPTVGTAGECGADWSTMRSRCSRSSITS